MSDITQIRDIARQASELVLAAPASEQTALLNELRASIAEACAPVQQPVDLVRWVPRAKLRANDYNPNSVPPRELALLKSSIMADGYTQPIVTIYDAAQDVYVIVDGFHRYMIGADPDVAETTQGLLPIVVIEADINERMACTVRHNRARGTHVIINMSDLVYRLLRNGWDDLRICQEIGLSADELVRLKHVTGYSKLYKDLNYSTAWLRGGQRDRMNRMADLRREKMQTDQSRREMEEQRAREARQRQVEKERLEKERAEIVETRKTGQQRKREEREQLKQERAVAAEAKKAEQQRVQEAEAVIDSG